jgi:hypothetical protein
MSREIVVELVRAGVRPEGKPGASGILLSDGATMPFIVERGWSGVAGYYNEQWSIRRGGKQVLYRSEPRQIFIRGLQSVTSYVDTADERIKLDDGNYELVFLIEGMFVGYIGVQARSLTGAPV